MARLVSLDVVAGVAIAAIVVVALIPDATAVVTVHEPYSMRTIYMTGQANFGAPPLSTRSIRAHLVIAEPIEGCSAPSTSRLERDAYYGRIVLAQRGGCSFTEKAMAAQRAGAIGIVIANTLGTAETGQPFNMADDGHGTEVRIHAEMISAADAEVLIRAVRDYREYVEVSIGHVVATPLYIS